MQPGVTVVLATVWLAVYVNVVGTTPLHPTRLTLDQYSPLALHHHGVYRRVEDQQDWKDQNPAENQPRDPSTGPRRSIFSSTESPEQSFGARYLKKDLLFPRLGNSAVDDFSPLLEDKQQRNFDGREFTDEKVDGRSTKTPELLSRELPPSELEDPFVADDTFQDQGPGSVEIYKLDLLREKPLLNPTPTTKLLTKNKNKIPKKTSHTGWKAKPTEYKATSPKILYKQSNSFDDSSSEMPPNNDPFSIGGVPELQVGCEGLEASNQKQRRSVDFLNKDQESPAASDLWTDVTPISLDVDYDLSSEDGYEEMDELFKLKKLETTTKKAKHNRGDMEATFHSDFFDDKKRAEKLPVRGDLGKVSNDSVIPSAVNQNTEGKESIEKNSNKDSRFTANQGRKILWLDDSDSDKQLEDEKRSKREAAAIWGFGEDDGVVTSDELQTENQRRRQDYERRRLDDEKRRQELKRRREEEARRRGYIENRTNADIERIRDDYERMLEQWQREEEERRRQGMQRATSSRWKQEEEHRRRVQEQEARKNRWKDEERQDVETSRRRFEPRPGTSPEEEERKRRLQWEEELRRRHENRAREEERRRQLQEEEARRKEQDKWREELKRRQEEEVDRRNLEERRREWMLKKTRREEEERRRQERVRNEPPSNLLYSMRAGANESRAYETETERRMRDPEVREREQKLKEYIQRNRPINVSTPVDRQREEANRRRLEEERRLQEYIRRNQPIRVIKVNGSQDRSWLEHRRMMEEAKLRNQSYPGPGSGRRSHGPSAPTNFYPQNYDARRGEAARRFEEGRIRERQREVDEQLRREALRREEEFRRAQSRRYEEQRKRQEAAIEAERRAKELMEEEARRSQAARTRPGYEDRRRFEEHRRRGQDTSLIPANLRLNESRRGIEHERQRQAMEWRRIEAERAKQARENDERARAMKEQWRRQEEARLNALPVSARIIVQSGASSSRPVLKSRIGFENDIDFAAPKFPATRRPLVKSPSPCTWAVVQCCPSNINRLFRCFETAGCPGINWDHDPCRTSITQAASEQIMKFYAEVEEADRTK